MPKEGFKSITIAKSLYEKIEDGMKRANKKAGCRRYRSKSHFLEEAVANYKPDC